VAGGLPTGTVTFLFTDLEGSTRLWEEHPEAMKPAVARQEEILRGAVQNNGGHVVKLTGDGVHAAFATAEAAVAAAVDGQLALRDEEWTKTGPLLVRMGLHTGTAELRGGDYYGSAVNRAARLMSVGHGRQIVISNATEELVRDVLPEGVQLVDLGEHLLADLGRPERVFQVIHPLLEHNFPSLRSVSAYPGNLPHQRTVFIGRRDELNEVTAMIGESDVVTLTGVGGVGKTRLAIQAAAESVHRFPDGAWFVDLGPVVESSSVPAAIATVLQLPERRQGPIEDGIIAALRRKRALLVVDNCEHVVDAAAEIVDALVASCPGVTVLATSREALSVEGEEAFAVTPLPLHASGGTGEDAIDSDAVRLFTERARAVRRGFALDRDSAPVVTEICRRLDGIPLAIELAAARVQSMSPADVLARLDERLRVLTRGRRATLERHQTLRAALDWSYELLEPEEQLAFARMSVFAGGFTLDGAEAVVADERVDAAAVLDLLAALVAKSMLVVDEAGSAVRYRLLETLREYAGDRLDEADATEAERVRDRHLAHYRALAVAAAPHLEGPDDAEWLRLLIADDDNLRVALTRARDTANIEALLIMASALSRYWAQYGNRRDGLMWLETALAMAPDAPARIRAEVMAFAGSHASDLGRYEDARGLLEGSLACSAEAGEPPSPLALRFLGILELEADRPDMAVRRCEEALAASREGGGGLDEVESLWHLTLVCALGADQDRATILADECVETARRLGNRYGLASALQAAGHAWLRADAARALAAFDESERLLFGPEMSFHMQILFFRGIARLRLGDLSLGARDIDEALARFDQGGNRYYISMTLALVATLTSGHDPGTAARILAAADRTRDDLGLGGAPHDAEARRRARERLESMLGPEEFAIALDEGRALDLSDAVALAHAVLDELVAPDETVS
jgi:predicted ATPase/class 3 adenylate cyclase